MCNKFCYNYECEFVNKFAECKKSKKYMSQCSQKVSERYSYGGFVGGRRFDRMDSFSSLRDMKRKERKEQKDKEELKRLRKLLKNKS